VASLRETFERASTRSRFPIRLGRVPRRRRRTCSIWCWAPDGGTASTRQRSPLRLSPRGPILSITTRSTRRRRQHETKSSPRLKGCALRDVLGLCVNQHPIGALRCFWFTILRWLLRAEPGFQQVEFGVRSSLAWPNSCRLSTFGPVIWPSVRPLDQGSVIAAATASRSAAMPLAKEPSRLFAAPASQASRPAQDFDRSSAWKHASRSRVTGSPGPACSTALARSVRELGKSGCGDKKPPTVGSPTGRLLTIKGPDGRDGRVSCPQRIDHLLTSAWSGPLGPDK
jgi:hypothetical protein